MEGHSVAAACTTNSSNDFGVNDPHSTLRQGCPDPYPNTQDVLRPITRAVSTAALLIHHDISAGDLFSGY